MKLGQELGKCFDEINACIYMQSRGKLAHHCFFALVSGAKHHAVRLDHSVFDKVCDALLGLLMLLTCLAIYLRDQKDAILGF